MKNSSAHRAPKHHLAICTTALLTFYLGFPSGLAQAGESEATVTLYAEKGAKVALYVYQTSACDKYAERMINAIKGLVTIPPRLEGFDLKKDLPWELLLKAGYPEITLASVAHAKGFTTATQSFFIFCSNDEIHHTVYLKRLKNNYEHYKITNNESDLSAVLNTHLPKQLSQFTVETSELNPIISMNGPLLNESYKLTSFTDNKRVIGIPADTVDNGYSIEILTPFSSAKKGISRSDLSIQLLGKDRFKYLWTLIPMAAGIPLTIWGGTLLSENGSCIVHENYQCAGRIHHEAAAPLLAVGLGMVAIPGIILLGKWSHYYHRTRTTYETR